MFFEGLFKVFSIDTLFYFKALRFLFFLQHIRLPNQTLTLCNG